MIKLVDMFVPATDEVWRLQRGTDPDCLFFQSFADIGHYRGKGGTRQGIYTCTASGKLLASLNTLNSKVVTEFLQHSLDLFDQIPEQDRSLPEGVSIHHRHRWEDSYPTSGLVLDAYSRDLSEADEPGVKWNRDHVWFNAAEARDWLPADPQPGDVYAIPEQILHRLTRFHLVDNVRGQTLPFAAKEIADSTLKATVLDRKDSIVTVQLDGNSTGSSKGSWLLGSNEWAPAKKRDYGVKATIKGKARFDLEQNRFLDFSMVALGHWSGSTRFNGRKGGPNSGRIGFAFTLAGDAAADRVAPAFVNVYNADWVVRPSRVANAE